MSKEVSKKPEEELDDRTERLIWRRLGRKSTRQIAEEIGVPPERVLRWKNEMLEGVDELSIAHRRMKLIADLQEVSDKARDLADVAIQDFQSGLLNTSVAAMKTLLVELSKLEKADNTRVEALNELRVRELAALMQEVVDSGIQDVAEAYDIDESELVGIFNAKLIEAAEKRDLS